MKYMNCNIMVKMEWNVGGGAKWGERDVGVDALHIMVIHVVYLVIVMFK